MSVVSKTELVDGNKDGVIDLSAKAAKALGVPTGTKLQAPGVAVEGGFRYLLVGEADTPPAPPPAPVKSAPDLPEGPRGDLVEAKGNGFAASGGIQANKLFREGSIVRKSTGAVLDSYAFTDCRTDGPGRLLYCEGGNGVRRFKLERVEGLNVKAGQPFVVLRGGPDGDFEVDVSDLRVVYVPEPNKDKGDIPTGLQLGGKGEGEQLRRATIRRLYVENALSAYSAGSYWNGDGGTAERSLQLLEMFDATFKNCVDGGLDSKARKNVLEWISAEGCFAALKLWDDTIATHVRSINPIKRGGTGGACHLRLMGRASRPPVIRVDDLVAVGKAPLLRPTNGPVEFHGTGSYDGPTIVQRDSGGTLVAGSTWNGSAIA